MHDGKNVRKYWDDELSYQDQKSIKLGISQSEGGDSFEHLDVIRVFRKGVLYIFYLWCLQLQAQPAISGHVNLEDSGRWQQKVYLAKLDVDHVKELKYAKQIAWSPINDDGTFSIDHKHISEKDAVYRLYVKRMEKAINDTITNGTTFILSSSDRMQFPEGHRLFANYTTTNKANLEWKKLRQFENRLLQSNLDQEDGAAQLKSYAKDSLRILMVKLIGIQQLEEKQLLDQDIAKNPDYYLALLTELKESGIPSAQFRFLEKKLAFLTQELTERKYARSKTIILILVLLVLGLCSILVFRRKSQPVLPDLSKQERNVQNLILQGKTNKEIARELFISLSTVKTHITNIYSKLKVADRRELQRRFQN